MHWLVVGASLGSALGSAVSTTLKRISATRAPALHGAGVRGLGRFVAATASSPFWLLALVADVVGVSLQIVALHYGALALVQPLLVSGLLFALLMRHVGHWRLSVREVVWAVLLVCGLLGFLVVSGATTAVQPSRADHGVAVAAAASVAAAVGLLLVIAQRSPAPARRAALLGLCVGAIYATTAALIKASTVVLADHGAVALLASWQLYVTLALGAAGLVLAQVAFQAGPLTVSLPAIATIDPLLSVLIGVVVYDERLLHGPGRDVVLFLLLVTLLVSIIGMSRLETESLELELQTTDQGRSLGGLQGGA